MEKREEIQDLSQPLDQSERKSWKDLEEEEESKDAKAEMVMQPQEYVADFEESGKQAKIKQITETYE